SERRLTAGGYLPDFFSILPQESFSGRVRLKTRLLGVESGSRQKKPTRSNWKRSSSLALAREGSSLAPVRISRELGLRLLRTLSPSSKSPGLALVKSLS